MEISGRAEIEYPCEWNYTIIGPDGALMRDAVGSLIVPHTCSVTESRSSSTGKYVSLNIRLVVQSQEERDTIYQKLAQCGAIKIVL